MFGMVLERVLISDLQKVSGDIERKVTAVGLSNLLIDCPAMLERPYSTYYPQLLAILVEFFELPQDQTTLPEDNILPENEDAPGYQVGYSQLLCAKNPPKDPLEGAINQIFSFYLFYYTSFSCCIHIFFFIQTAVGDVRLHLAQGLARLSPRQLLDILDQIPEPNANHLRDYLQTVGITVA